MLKALEKYLKYQFENTPSRKTSQQTPNANKLVDCSIREGTKKPEEISERTKVSILLAIS